MSDLHFGTTLRQAREQRSLSLADIARTTKVPVSLLRLVESADLDALPPEVFVRGFIRSYARALGISETEPLALFDSATDARRRAQQAVAVEPTAPASPLSIDPIADDEGGARRGVGIFVAVIIVLLIATITLSLFLGQPPQSGERLSHASPVAGEVLALCEPIAGAVPSVPGA